MLAEGRSGGNPRGPVPPPLRWVAVITAGVGVSTQPEARAAAEEAAARALAAGARADLAVLFCTSDHAGSMPTLLDTAMGSLGTRALVGATAHGVLGEGRELDAGPAVSVLALGGVEAEPFLLQDVVGHEEAISEEIAQHLPGSPTAEDLVLLLPDPRVVRPQHLLPAIGKALGPALVVGAGAADPLSAHPLQWCGRRVEEQALAGVALRLPRQPRVGVTQACRPATGLMAVTRAQGNWILELDGRPALEVYREVARGRLAEDLRRAAAFVLVALPRDPHAPLDPGGYLVRNVAGFELDRQAFAIPEPVAAGQQIALVQREPETAREDLKEVLGRLGGSPPAAGLYLDCCARGAALFGVSGLEAGYLESAFRAAPIAGMLGSCEIGPIAGGTELLTYTGVLALLDA